MIRIIYLIILLYFLLGGIGFYLINRRKEPEVARKSYTKFISYFFIINILFFSIIFNSILFIYLSVLIIAVSFFELFKLFYKSGFKEQRFFIISILIMTVLSEGFFFFSGLDKGLILFSFLVLSIFDSFSQITGQLWGKTKIFPAISPNKTLGGLIGGGLIALLSAFLLSDLYYNTHFSLIIITIGLLFFAFCGDIAASFYKRKFKVKDYSNLIPGHGGFLDRFDSLITGGAWIAFCFYVLNFQT
ncbi:MAG: phosphatidate cytidylyltransferase [Bacteroidales bacterium]|jgi:phosphatidate cytidylyltransferase|nr:phosphatidate cytidylyltransferase [Bacteroidales bacterium]